MASHINTSHVYMQSTILYIVTVSGLCVVCIRIFGTFQKDLILALGKVLGDDQWQINVACKLLTVVFEYSLLVNLTHLYICYQKLGNLTSMSVLTISRLSALQNVRLRI